jgi:hypothetical protein
MAEKETGNRLRGRSGIRSRWARNQSSSSLTSATTAKIGEIHPLSIEEHMDLLPMGGHSSSLKDQEEIKETQEPIEEVVNTQESCCEQTQEQTQDKEALVAEGIVEEQSEQAQVEVNAVEINETTVELISTDEQNTEDSSDDVILSEFPSVDVQEKTEMDELSVVEIIGRKHREKKQQRRKEAEKSESEDSEDKPKYVIRKLTPEEKGAKALEQENAKKQRAEHIHVEDADDNRRTSADEWKPNRSKSVTSHSQRAEEKKPTSLFAKIRSIVSSFFSDQSAANEVHSKSSSKGKNPNRQDRDQFSGNPKAEGKKGKNYNKKRPQNKGQNRQRKRHNTRKNTSRDVSSSAE